MSKVIATFDRPRYAIEKRVPVYDRWEVIATDDNEFNARSQAEKMAKKHDTQTRVIDRGEDQ